MKPALFHPATRGRIAELHARHHESTAIADKFEEMNLRLETGERRPKPRKKKKNLVGRKPVESRGHRSVSTVAKHKGVKMPVDKGKRSHSIRAISGGLPSLGKKR
jgi:hypothetical protein